MEVNSPSQMINKAIKKNRINRFMAMSKALKLPVTPQKLAIFEYLAGTDTHPKAENIFKAVQAKFANISDGTIYKNLKKLIAQGLVKELNFKGELARYDANVDHHDHIVNLSTGEIKDLPSKHNLTLPTECDQYQLDHISVTYYVK